MENRKKFLIDKQFQLKFIISSAILISLIFIANFVAAYIFIRHLKQLGVQTGLPAGSDYFTFVDQQAYILFTIMIIIFVIVSIISILWTLKFSFKVAGPVWRINKELANNSKNISIRKGDFFQDLVVSINKAINNEK